MIERGESRLLLRAGLSSWVLAALASIWHGLAQQAPSSPLHVGILAGPIAQLRDHALALGGTLLAGGVLWSWLYPVGRGRLTLASLLLGSAVTLAALAYGAVHGVFGVQAGDPRSDVRWLVLARALGLTLLLLGGIAAAWRSFRRG